MSKHTPGPWSIGDDNNATCEVIAGPVAIPLDRIGRSPDAGSEYIISRDEMIANARLIAAAPDLLAACIQAAISLRAVYGLLPYQTCSEVILLDDAIAKATKEKP